MEMERLSEGADGSALSLSQLVLVSNFKWFWLPLCTLDPGSGLPSSKHASMHIEERRKSLLWL
jgi:hypothetical protein